LIESIHLLGFAGSLRRASFNRALLRAAIEMMPEKVTVERIEIGDIPLYSAELDSANPPEAVLRFRERIAAADGLLIASPEYNYSIPGGLKNALDWASRPPATSVLKHKPIGIMGASGGRFGTVRGQLALRQVFLFTESYFMLKPELQISNSALFFDESGKLHDVTTRKYVQAFVDALVAWTDRLSQLSANQ
jgi:chromate reductase